MAKAIRAIQRARARETRRAWRERNRERIRQWNQDNAEKKQEYDRRYRELHREEMNECTKAWRRRNPEKVQEANRVRYQQIKERLSRRYQEDEGWREAKLRRGRELRLEKKIACLERWGMDELKTEALYKLKALREEGEILPSKSGEKLYDAEVKALPPLDPQTEEEVREAKRRYTNAVRRARALRHRERMRAYQQAWRERHRERIREQQRAYRERHREAIRERARNRRRARRDTKD